jgi:hypothetical protein
MAPGGLTGAIMARTKIVACDLLGRSGRADEPMAGHFDPDIEVEFIENTVRFVLACPSFCLLNPIEVNNNDAQRFVRLWKRPAGFDNANDPSWQPGGNQGPQNLKGVARSKDLWCTLA